MNYSLLSLVKKDSGLRKILQPCIVELIKGGMGLKLLLNILSKLPLSWQRKIAQTYMDGQLKKKVDFHIHQIENLQHVNRPTIFIANHLSNIDGILLAKLLEEYKPRFVAGIKLSQDKYTNFFKNLVRTIEIKPNTPDKEALKQVIQELKAGFHIMIFPEGTRSRTGSLIEARRGIYLIAKLSGAQVLPLSIMGTEIVLPINKAGEMNKERICAGRVDITIGEPVQIPAKADGEERKAYEKRCVDTMMVAIAKNLKPQYQGVYQNCDLSPVIAKEDETLAAPIEELFTSAPVKVVDSAEKEK